MCTESTEKLQSWLRLISFLLQYPDDSWQQVLNECQVIDPSDGAMAPFIHRFVWCLEEEGIDGIQMRYVQTFDFGKKTNLYLTYARHGEQRERGAALLSLKQVYAQHGFHMVDDELSDYLPLLLEFVSVASPDAGVPLLCEHRPAIEEIREHLAKMDSPYVDIFDALLFVLDQWGIQPVAKEGVQ
ncbi:nitrate reductase molybdenum cofactor assembly chaperone [Paludifilum halophilum]|uniref:Nitrate reductase molybdenum cofactor assembly chaperone n=1 Tax=Paludifilum halophilum TaxID=1642702 RepID=A0A235B4Y6_9BACL|nr:nitrate reductase molybdenum cofactor assembly chaperone [Paludifilum halophilum]OYD06675.1 nitrate reductase molybdenum cofactor assembly chaperone [Paludifilum halophilum]